MGTKIKFIINKSEITAGTRGASLGPEAIMTAARKKNNYFFGEYPKEYLVDSNELLDSEIKFHSAKRIMGLLHVFENVEKSVSTTISDGVFPVVLAGDHGSAGGTIAGIKAAYPDKRLGVIWVDAHADIHTPYTTPSGNMHGMPLATALGVDNIECKVNDPLPEVVDMWEKLKNVGVDGPKVLPQDLIYIAVRDTEAQENYIMEKLAIKNFEVADVRAQGVQEIMDQCMDRLSDCDMIYLSYDVDSMDPEHTSHGTGTPVGNGLLPEEGMEILEYIAKQPKTVCIEFVEVNPCLDEKVNTMAEIAFKLVENTVNTLIKR